MKIIKALLLAGIIILSSNFQVNAEKNSINPSQAIIGKVQQEEPEKQFAKGSVTIVKNKNSQHKYIIAPEDILAISVYGEPDLTQPEIIVRPDGYATIEPIGELYVEGYYIEELTKIVESELNYFLKEPKVSINVRVLHPASIYVYGAVQKPGTYQQVIQTSKYAADSKNPTVKTKLSISNVLSNAGGVNYNADLNNIIVTSKDGTKTKVNLWNLLKDGDVSQDIVLRSDDTVYVPKIENIIYGDEEFETLARSSIFPEVMHVRVLGEVNRSGLYEIPTNTPYLHSAIAIASGYKLEAAKNAIQIKRKNLDGKISKINIDVDNTDFVLRPNDIVFVKDRKIIKVVNGATYLSKILSPFTQTASMINGWLEVFDPTRRYDGYYR